MKTREATILVMAFVISGMMVYIAYLHAENTKRLDAKVTQCMDLGGVAVPVFDNSGFYCVQTNSLIKVK